MAQRDRSGITSSAFNVRRRPLLGRGYRDPTLQAFVGEPLTWQLEATNRGGARDTYALSWEAEFPCQVRFTNKWGNEISKVSVKGLTRNYLHAEPAYFNVEVIPTETLPKNEPMEVTIRLGPGDLAASTSEVTVQVVNPGMLHSVNDLDSMRPRAHRVMPGETTTFLFHITNLEASAVDIELEVSGNAGDWTTGLDKTDIVGLPPAQAEWQTKRIGIWGALRGIWESLKKSYAGLAPAPAQTEQAILSVTPPLAAEVGDRLELTVTARSSEGAEESVDVAIEVTDVRNIYYFSIDSMDPEYLYLDRAGTGPGSDGDWLMPNIRAFMDDGVNYTNARVYLPSATDMNHTNALAGTYSGTQGIYMVGGTLIDINEYDELIYGPNSMDLMRYGPEGEPVKRIFEVAKEETEGKALTGLWSNKNWLAEIHGERTLDIVGHSERFPLFFPPPYRYVAGDLQTDENPADPVAAPFSSSILDENNAIREILVPGLLGQFNRLFALGIYTLPVNIQIGMFPGNHCEDRYLFDSFLRTIVEEDPVVSYFNAADLDHVGHFTGASWNLEEWDDNDESKFSPWMRRDEVLDICREIDVLFAEFIQLLKDRGVYDNSIIVVLSDHGMQNMKDQSKGYEVLNLREILRKKGLVHKEDYFEGGGTEINFIWCDDDARLQAIEEILKGYTVDDPELGPVQPLIVINREEAITGVDFGGHGRVRPMELYSEFWASHPDEPDGHLWPDLFIFPLYNYQVASHGQVLATGINVVGINIGNVPDNVQVGFSGAHGGLQTANMVLIFKAPAGWKTYRPGTVITEEVEIGDIAPTIYGIMGWEEPDSVDGKPLPY